VDTWRSLRLIQLLWLNLCVDLDGQYGYSLFSFAPFPDPTSVLKRILPSAHFKRPLRLPALILSSLPYERQIDQRWRGGPCASHCPAFGRLPKGVFALPWNARNKSPKTLFSTNSPRPLSFFESLADPRGELGACAFYLSSYRLCCGP